MTQNRYKDPLILDIPVPVSKTHTTITKWHLYQEHPYPDFEWNLTWRNHEGIFPQYGRPAIKTLEMSYMADLLRPDWDAGEHMLESRESHSGYDGSLPALVVRGKPIGEVRCEIQKSSQTDSGYVVRYKATGLGESLDKWTLDLLKQHVTPTLEYVVKNMEKDLYVQAVQGVKEAMMKQVDDAVRELEARRKEAVSAVKKLEENYGK
jgi:hypothetical protein